MSYRTARFGAIDFADSDVITIRAGIAPFVAARRFVILSDPEEWPFSWLQSLDDPALAFAVAPIPLLFPEHGARLEAMRKRSSGGRTNPDETMWGIVVLDPDPARLTINLLAPLFIDLQTMEGEQKVFDGPAEYAREFIQPALMAMEVA